MIGDDVFDTGERVVAFSGDADEQGIGLGVEFAVAKGELDTAVYLTQLEVTGLTAEILASANSEEDFAAAQQANMLWVAVNEADEPVGFALLDEIDQWLYLDELDVQPEYGRRGIGTALVKHVCQWAREAGYPGVTLSTFKDVVWNAPFYGRLGFQAIPPHKLTLGLQNLLAWEKERGLHTDKRVIMCFDLSEK